MVNGPGLRAGWDCLPRVRDDALTIAAAARPGLEQQSRVDPGVTRLREREGRAGLLEARHLDLDRQLLVEQLLCIDQEIEVDQRELRAALAVTRLLGLEEERAGDLLPVRQQVHRERPRNAEPGDVLHAHRNRS